ncbi:class I SAM-dependent methyltransferase [Candidatus Pelagibacter sp. Uisw_106]|uniref:class I SAM-dependent methyltransferase n=1 Tax=Candidatus Pelagibacter sp. Uisw_106 TaxID=3230984 RepID=UPI0039E87391
MKDITNQKGLNSIWTDSLARNLHPDGNALVNHLRTVHQEHTGFTEACASSCRDEAGRNSYEWLAELVPDNESFRVLDLACGSGPLLKILFDRNRNLNLKGIDMCPEELALAKTRLINTGVNLIESKAQNLTAINDNSIDIVLCHWALTLMDPITPVLDEIRRVLTSEGRFAALVDGPMNVAPGYKEVHDLIYSYVQEVIPSYGEIDLGDPRIRGSESLSNLVNKSFPEANVTIETKVVSMEGPVTQVAEIAAGFFYAAFVLKPEKRKLMITSLSNLLAISKESTDAERQGRFSMPISRLLVVPDIK